MPATVGTPLLWTGFLVLIFAMLALDLGVFNRKTHRIGMKEAIFWSIVWTLVALVFNGWVYYRFGRQQGLDFLTGYVIERSLSFDNIFVFIVIFSYFKVPDELQHRVLFWGILGALISRGIFIIAGTELLDRFEWLIYVFGAFLVYTGVKVLVQKDTEIEPEKNPVVSLFRRFTPMTDRYHGKHFFIQEAGKRLATPLLLVLVVVESTDVVFAVDSIPAVLAITRDPFIVFTSNIFAILGLRALYFLLASLVHKFHYLSYGLGLVLMFVGVKMLIHHYYVIPTAISLWTVLGILALSIGVSFFKTRDLPPVEPAASSESSGD